MHQRFVGQRSVSIAAFHEALAAENEAVVQSGVKPEIKEEPIQVASSSNAVLPPLGPWPLLAEPPPRGSSNIYIYIYIYIGFGFKH